MNCIICERPMSPLQKDLHKCDSCLLISSSLKADKDIYDEQYYKKYEQYANTSTGRKINKFRWNFVKMHMIGGTVLDYGCGYGHFAKTRHIGFSVRGYDINPFTDANKERVPHEDEYDAVTFWDVLEHIDEPQKVVCDLKPKWVFGTVPNIGNVSGDPTEWKHYRPHEHVHHFSPESIVKFLRAIGYATMTISVEEGVIRDPEHPSWLITFSGERR